ncbi:lysine-2,3-aminomutase-like protein [Agrobacterium sp. a22-2]|uniref:lysine-2,3-aminomutase-like protein n=1 Tax=Agrobacterium sp. a22-2 TaxID=2283840 RepID=UPI001445924D|nr:lysine-2,3-aminomutase-like protein [Agrobacterium sp. a22-2]NKN39732.1 lysine-2,3-aminomutase-like protein [Agrobacterium sp. a22-2]
MKRRSLTSVDDLQTAGLIEAAEAEGLRDVGSRYAIAITPTLVDLIDQADQHDPIVAQFVPTKDELVQTADENADPIGDHAHSPVEGIVHRYPDRVLLKAVHICPVYCRFCFRREMVGPKGDGTLSADALERALDYIRAHAEIWEVILTGGDPLVLSPRRLAAIMQGLANIPHVRIVRFHTRVPVVDPGHVDQVLVDAIRSSGKTTYVALHANHPREMTPEAKSACARLIDSGIVMVSQTVLLKGINDDAAVLTDLMRTFVEWRIKPYYLHHPDKAPGTGHFRVSIAQGQAIVGALRGTLSGLCQPTYVLDIPGGYGKTPIGMATISAQSAGDYLVEDYRGAKHRYTDG